MSGCTVSINSAFDVRRRALLAFHEWQRRMAACVSDDFDPDRHARQTRGRHFSQKNGNDKPYGEIVSSTSRAIGRTTRHLDAIAVGLSVAGPFVCRCLISRTLLRFHTPLVKPDGRFSRIRLSDKESRFRTRKVVALGFWKALRQVYPSTREQRCWVRKTAQRARQTAQALAGRGQG